MNLRGLAVDANVEKDDVMAIEALSVPEGCGPRNCPGNSVVQACHSTVPGLLIPVRSRI